MNFEALTTSNRVRPIHTLFLPIWSKYFIPTWCLTTSLFTINGWNSMEKIKPVVLGILLLALFGVFLLDISVGSVKIPFSGTLKILFGVGVEKESWSRILTIFRLPKAITALLAGAALAVSGLQMQTLFRNPLAGPFILGISSGAGLGVAIVVLSAATGGTADFLYGIGLFGQAGIGIVLTERVNVGMLSSFALVALGRHPYTGWSGRLTTEDHAAVEWALKAVGAAELSSQHVAEISDGERQKVMIARALAQAPRLIILDEPTAYLDLPRRAEIMSLLKRLARTTHRAIIFSTHDLELALRSADGMWLLSHGKEICRTNAMTGKAATISTGAPEDLALDGSMDNTFESEGVTFDQRNGSFVIAADREE